MGACRPVCGTIQPIVGAVAAAGVDDDGDHDEVEADDGAGGASAGRVLVEQLATDANAPSKRIAQTRFMGRLVDLDAVCAWKFPRGVALLSTV
jgi:hypothetical protein